MKLLEKSKNSKRTKSIFSELSSQFPWYDVIGNLSCFAKVTKLVFRAFVRVREALASRNHGRDSYESMA
jgi:hypothetical protein